MTIIAIFIQVFNVMIEIYFWLIQNGRFKMGDVSSTLFDNK